ncbi:MAG TPA: hypothetical protein VHB21_25205, partial [Minicystis sp.]|nr:hypothetical protein [Minicystis sp.]
TRRGTRPLRAAATAASHRSTERPRRRRNLEIVARLITAAVLAVAAFAASARASAEPAPANGSASGAQRIVEVRLALSSVAQKDLAEARVRRLLEIELGDNALLAPGATGPLGDHVAYVWIDEPAASRFEIEVRIGDRPVARRELELRGFPADVAARFVVVATAEMVRAQMQPPPRRRVVPERKRPTPEEIERASRPRPAVGLVGAADVLWVPESSGVLAGPSLGAGFRVFGAEETVFGRLLTGHTDAGATRLLEAGLALDYRIWLAPGARVALGGAFAMTAVHLGDGASADGVPGESDSWTARAGGLAGLELRLVDGAWLGVALEPGALLRPVPYQTSAVASSLRGAYLGLRIALTLERVSHPPVAP